MTVRRGVSLSAAAALLTAACAAPPRDPEGTLERVRGGVIRVGITENPPWTTLSGDQPDGVEVELVEQLAAELNADVEWFEGPEERLFGALKYGQLDLIIGGLAAQNPFAREAAFTYPYVTSRVVIAVPSSEVVPDNIAGLLVAVEEGTEEAGVLEETDARRVLVDDIAVATGARAIGDWLLDDFGLVDTGITLIETEHVMAVRLGENGWMVTIERFLLERPERIEGVLDDKGDL
jgi:polar amino acid transport system substrate-binding protein